MSGARHPTVTEAGPVHDQREIDAVVAVLQAPGRLAIGPEVAEFERRDAVGHIAESLSEYLHAVG